MGESFVDLSSLFTVNQPVAPSQDQTYILNGTVHESIDLMEVNGARFGSPSQFALRPIDSDWNKWSFQVGLTSTRTFNVRVAMIGSESGDLIADSEVFDYTDTDVQLALNEAFDPSGEFTEAAYWLSQGWIDAGEYACIIADPSLSSISGEYSASGEWIQPDYLTPSQLRIRGWKRGQGPFGYTNAEISPRPYPGSNTMLNSRLIIPASTSNDYMQRVIDAGFVTGDRPWTHLFRHDFTLGEDFVEVTAMVLNMLVLGEVEVFLNGVSVYRSEDMKCGTEFPWGFTEYAR